MTKQESIEKIREAADRVCKKQDFAAGAVASIDVVITKLTTLRDDIQKDGDVDWEDLTAIGECFRILDTVYGGYPMVPASEDVEKASSKKIAKKEFAEHAASELEAAAAEPIDKRVLRIAALKVALAAYEAAPDGDAAEIPVVAPEGIPALAKAAVAAEALKKQATPAAATPPSPGAATAESRIEAVAKAATPTQPQTAWPIDMSPGRPARQHELRPMASVGSKR